MTSKVSVRQNSHKTVVRRPDAFKPMRSMTHYPDNLCAANAIRIVSYRLGPRPRLPSEHYVWPEFEAENFGSEPAVLQ